MLNEIAAIFQARGLVTTAWLSEMQQKGSLVKLYRDYYEGNHRLKLTAAMRQMMQITDDRLDRYNANYCEMVISSIADRLTVDTIEALTPPGGGGESSAEAAQNWAIDLLDVNRFDALQIDVREAALRDGETFVMAQYDDASGRVVLAHELAWDGDTGMMVVYDRQGKEIVAAAKVWYEGEWRRANLYYPNSLEKYRYETVQIDENGQKTEKMQLAALDKPIDTTAKGARPGVPVVRFVNKSKKGSSELVNVIPLQDSLNSTLISAVMNALLTAFAILFAKGFKPPAGVTPGMIIHAMLADADGNAIATEDKEKAEAFAALMDVYGLERIQPGEVEPLIRQCEFLIMQIGTVSFTPVPGLMGGDSQSGEALQERRVGQLGKVNAAQVRLGNAWEDLMKLAARVHNLYGTTVVPEARWSTRWKSAEIRNDGNILKAAELLQKWGFEREALRLMSQSSLAQYSEDDIERMMAEKRADAAQGIVAAAGSLDGFGQFSL